MKDQKSNFYSFNKSEIYRFVKNFRLTLGKKTYKSSIIDQEVTDQLRKNLTIKYQAATSWNLIFSDTTSGRCHKEMIYSLKKNSGPFIMIIKDLDGGLFGAYFENQLQHHIGSFGRGSTALFKIRGSEVDWYKSDGVSINYCISGSTYFAFGCSNSKYGLLVWDDLLHGESNSVSTFGNEQLSNQKTFKISRIEIWNILEDY